MSHPPRTASSRPHQMHHQHPHQHQQQPPQSPQSLNPNSQFRQPMAHGGYQSHPQYPGYPQHPMPMPMGQQRIPSGGGPNGPGRRMMGPLPKQSGPGSVPGSGPIVSPRSRPNMNMQLPPGSRTLQQQALISPVTRHPPPGHLRIQNHREPGSPYGFAFPQNHHQPPAQAQALQRPNFPLRNSSQTSHYTPAAAASPDMTSAAPMNPLPSPIFSHDDRANYFARKTPPPPHAPQPVYPGVTSMPRWAAAQSGAFLKMPGTPGDDVVSIRSDDDYFAEHHRAKKAQLVGMLEEQKRQGREKDRERERERESGGSSEWTTGSTVATELSVSVSVSSVSGGGLVVRGSSGNESWGKNEREQDKGDRGWDEEEDEDEEKKRSKDGQIADSHVAVFPAKTTAMTISGNITDLPIDRQLQEEEPRTDSATQAQAQAQAQAQTQTQTLLQQKPLASASSVAVSDLPANSTTIATASAAESSKIPLVPPLQQGTEREIGIGIQTQVPIQQQLLPASSSPSLPSQQKEEEEKKEEKTWEAQNLQPLHLQQQQEQLHLPIQQPLDFNAPAVTASNSAEFSSSSDLEGTRRVPAAADDDDDDDDDAVAASAADISGVSSHTTKKLGPPGEFDFDSTTTTTAVIGERLSVSRLSSAAIAAVSEGRRRTLHRGGESFDGFRISAYNHDTDDDDYDYDYSYNYEEDHRAYDYNEFYDQSLSHDDENENDEYLDSHTAVTATATATAFPRLVKKKVTLKSTNPANAPIAPSPPTSPPPPPHTPSIPASPAATAIMTRPDASGATSASSSHGHYYPPASSATATQSPVVENFSRPRKYSIRTVTPESPAGFPQLNPGMSGPAPTSHPVNPVPSSVPGHNERFLPPVLRSERMTQWPRPRGASGSSVASATSVASGDGRRTRPPPVSANNANNAAVFGMRSGLPRNPSAGSVFYPVQQPWMAQEPGIRSSMRSSNSGRSGRSRGFGTPGSSLYGEERFGQDDALVDDVMGMYYQGFADSDSDVHGIGTGNETEEWEESGLGVEVDHDRVQDYVEDFNQETRRRVSEGHGPIGVGIRERLEPMISRESTTSHLSHSFLSVHPTPLSVPRNAQPSDLSLARGISSPPLPLDQSHLTISKRRSKAPRNITPLDISVTPQQISSLGQTQAVKGPATPGNRKSGVDALSPEAPARRPRPRSSSVPPNMAMGRAVAVSAIKEEERKKEEEQKRKKDREEQGMSLGVPRSPGDTPLRSPTLLSRTPTITSPISRAPTPPPVSLEPDKSQVKPEDPMARDRYGFRKENQYISRAVYDKWDTEYTLYLARRKKKWIAYMKECGLVTTHPTRFPPRSAKTKRFIRKGIPPEWRGAAWFYYAGGPAIMAKYAGLYARLLKEDVKPVDSEAIERDLHRTFPDNIKFRPNGVAVVRGTEGGYEEHMVGDRAANSGRETPIIEALRRVLRAFAVHNPAIGYCQSLNFLAGLLLLFIDNEEHCFWLLNVITRFYLPGTHETSLEGSKVDLAVLMSCLAESLPDLFAKLTADPDDPLRPAPAKQTVRSKVRPKRRDPQSVLGDRLPPITLFMTSWFMNSFIGVLPIETTLRVWDTLFLEGSKTFFRISMTIFRLGEAQIRLADPMEIFPVVQGLPRRLIDANAVMEMCFRRRGGFGGISQQVVDERRAECRRQGALERRGTGEGEVAGLGVGVGVGRQRTGI